MPTQLKGKERLTRGNDFAPGHKVQLPVRRRNWIRLADEAENSATDGAGNVKTSNYQVIATGPSSSTPVYDANGNMTSDGTNSYAWDAQNRLIQLTYPGTGNNSQFTYDPFSGLVKIVETAAGSITSTKQFVRCGSQMCEERNASSIITKQFFGWGQTLSGTDYYYFRNILGSVTDVFTSTGTVQAHYEYGMYGEVTQTVGTLASDFQYAGMYFHEPSGLNLATYRAYSPSLCRWINRDPIGENGGTNLYGYVGNNPISRRDPSGLIEGVGTMTGILAAPETGGLSIPVGILVDIVIAGGILGVGYGGAVIVHQMQGNGGSGSGAGSKSGTIDCSPGDGCDPPGFINDREQCFAWCRNPINCKGAGTGLCAVRCDRRFPKPSSGPPPPPYSPPWW